MTSPNLRYLNEFFDLSCAKGLLVTEAFGRSNPAKEITEAFGMFRALAKCWDDGLKCFGRKDVRLIVVGDGVTPRLGATAALRSNWEVLSMDPVMHDKWVGPHKIKDVPNGINRLTCWRGKGEDWNYEPFQSSEIVLAFPHSHAKIQDVVDRVKCRRLHVVSNPCCVPSLINGRPIPDEEYDDWGIHSEKRKIQIWRDVL